MILLALWLIYGKYNWNSVKTRLTYMNILLTAIPVDKLSEEVTLHMLKTIRNF